MTPYIALGMVIGTTLAIIVIAALVASSRGE